MKKLIVIDFGGQYTHLIATQIRSLGVCAEIMPAESFSFENRPDVAGIVLSGGPHSVLEPGSPTIGFPPGSCPVPILGLCYGHQLLGKLLGGKVVQGKQREYGLTRISCQTTSRIFNGLPARQDVWMSHGDHVESLPPGFKIIADSEDIQIAAFESPDGRIFGLQFHPEVVHTRHGVEILERFLEICTSERSWKPGTYRQRIIEEVRQKAADRLLFLLVSGGVDSLVALRVCLEAVGNDRVKAIHVDTGLMRKDESSEIMGHLEKLGFKGIHLIRAADTFLQQLKGLVDPEEKRKVIGRLFVEIANEEIRAMKLPENCLLVQGTIYPDRIESGSGKNSAKIKTHHNRVDEIRAMMKKGRVLEPLGDLYKHEVRALGRELGLPETLLERHPFPGPGLGIRVLCSSTDSTEHFDAREESLLNEIAAQYSLKGKILPVKSVGVQGDSRTYAHPAVIWFPPGTEFQWESAIGATRAIVNRLRTVNRVVLSLSPEPTVLLKAAPISESRLEHLREVDATVRHETEIFSEIWQMPVISLPAVDEAGKEIFVIRPVLSRDAMTADVFLMPQPALQALLTKLTALPYCGQVLYDLTSKPPGTIEWE